MAPQVGGRLVLFFVTPGFLRRRPAPGDFTGGRARLDRVDGVVQPLQRRCVDVLLLLRRFLAHAVSAVVTGLVTVPGQRGQIHEDDVAGLDDPVGEVAPVGPGIGTRGDDDILHVFHSRNVVQVLHDVRGHLVLGDAGLEKLHRLPVRAVADGADDAQALLLVFVLDSAGFHHRRHAVSPVDAGVLERAQEIDVDKVEAHLLARDVALLHLLQHGVGELLDLLLRGGTRRALDPGVGVAHVLLGNPRRMPLDLEADVSLLEQYRWIVAAEHGVAQSGLEPVPSRCQGAGNVTNVLVVQQYQRAEAVRLHSFPGAFQPIVSQPVPVDPLLPVQSNRAEIRHARSSASVLVRNGGPEKQGEASASPGSIGVGF